MNFEIKPLTGKEEELIEEKISEYADSMAPSRPHTEEEQLVFKIADGEGNVIGGITSYTIRVSATQSYVPDERKGRFNGAFNMLSTSGALLGEVMSGVLTVFMPERTALLSVMLLCALAAVVFIGGGREHVSYIYNRSE